MLRYYSLIFFLLLITNDRNRLKACSFSRLTWTHLRNMGIVKNESVADIRRVKAAFDLRLKVFQNRRLSEIFPPFWHTLINDANFLPLLKMITETVGKRVRSAFSAYLIY